MEIQVAVAKANQYASLESGDTLEVVERPNGGVSIVLSDGRASGRDAKAVSTMVVRKVIALLAEGVRDGAAARAASDYLFTERHGNATAYLNILSADLQSGTLVITRNNPTPIFVAHGDRVECLAGEANPIGVDRNVRPAVLEIALQPGTTVVMYTDGLTKAGRESGEFFDVCMLLDALVEDDAPSAQEIADQLLAQAMRLDNGHPNDDMSVVALQVLARTTDQVRRLSVSLPVSKGIITDYDETGSQKD